MDTTDVDKTRAMELAISFIGDQWTCLTEDDITVSIFSGGYSDRLYIVEDVSKTCHRNTTQKFLVRLYGGKLIKKDDIINAGKCETGEGIVFFANSLHGLGPKLLGIFHGGRVEEFVPSHRLTEMDLVDSKLSLELARKLARFHALQLPVSKKKRDVLYISAVHQDGYNEERLKQFIEHSGCTPDDCSYLYEDYQIEHTFLRSFESKVGGRLVLCHGDLNKNNILVRDKPDRFNEQIMLIDYERAATDYRGIDLGGIMLGKMFELKYTAAFDQVCEWPNDDYRRMFINEYLHESKKLNYRDFDTNGLDSVDHVLMEVDFFVMYELQLFLGIIKKVCNNEATLQMPPAMIKSTFEVIPVMREIYAARKDHFIEKYSKVL